MKTRPAVTPRPRRLPALIVALVLAATCLALAVEWAARTRRQQLRFIQHAAGVTIPPSADHVFLLRDFLPPRHKWLSGHLVIPPLAIQAYIKQHPFRAWDSPDLSFVFSLHKMPDACQSVRHENTLYNLSGYTADKELPFEFLLDAATGDLWINLQYDQ